MSFREWLNPFDRPEATVAFNRLFSEIREDGFIDSSDMSNFWQAYISAEFSVSEKVTAGISWNYYQAVEAFDRPVTFSLGRYEVPVAPNLSFWTREGSKDMGHQLTLGLVYQYSNDVSVEAGWTHYFVGEGINDGVFVGNNALSLVEGESAEDADVISLYVTVDFGVAR